MTMLKPTDMKILNLLFVLIPVLLAGCTGNEGVSIQGHAENSDNEYIVLNYMPRIRGCLNFDNFRNTGTRINDEGYFSFSADDLTHAADYQLSFKDNYIPLVLFKGDKLDIEFDINDPGSTCFMTGKGAGKNNILHLIQFRPDMLFDVKYSIDEYKARIDSITGIQTTLLNAIRAKDPDNEIVANAKNRDKIERIINENSVTDEEFRFIENIILSESSALSGFITYLCSNTTIDSTEVDFSDDLFSVYNKSNYDKIDNTNDFRVANALERILYLEFLRDRQAKGEIITYSNWDKYQYDTVFTAWIPDFIRTNFNSDIFDKYYAEAVVIRQTLGINYTKSYEELRQTCTNLKYLDRIDQFEELLDTGLENPEYNLGLEEKTLDRESFERLINGNDEMPVFITFWSARFAGATILPHLPAIREFESNIKDDFRVLNICIDEKEHKNLWAARIVDNKWKADHYFLPIEGNDSTLIRFNCTRISSFCLGGAKYSLVDTGGNIINDLESPMTLTKEKLVGYLK